MGDLDAAADELDAARMRVMSELVWCWMFVDRAAAAGDAEALALSRRVRAAVDRSTCAAVVGATAIAEAKR
jgi:hypothetical protein